MNKQIQNIVKELKKNISDKYKISEMRLFGSTARGGAKSDSDIDIYICLSEVNRNIEEDIFDKAYDLELKYDRIIDIFVFDERIKDGINAQLPIYKNIMKEGIII